MAIFNLLAECDKKEIDIDILFTTVKSTGYKYIYIFPVLCYEHQELVGVGLTASGKDFLQMTEVKQELILLLGVLWDEGFVVTDLYTGHVVTIDNYKSVFSYFR